MPRSASGFRNSGSKTMVDSNSSTKPLWRGIPNFVGKSLRIRAIVWIATFSIYYAPTFLKQKLTAKHSARIREMAAPVEVPKW